MVATLEKKPPKRRIRGGEKPKLDLSFAQACPIVTRTWTQARIMMVGCGGTGSWLAPSLARLVAVLREAGKSAELTFIDPDRVEAKNIPRQNFCQAELGANKAQALALRFSEAWGIPIGAVSTTYGEKYPRRPDPTELLVLVGCVDNAEARRALSATVANYNKHNAQSFLAPQTWWLDCGNSGESGQVLLGTTPRAQAPLFRGAFSGGMCMALPLPTWQRPELLRGGLEEQADAEERLSCAELTLRNFQSMGVNPTVAVVAADYLFRLLLTGGLRKFATYFDLASGATRSLYTTPEVVAASVGKTPAMFDGGQTR